MLKFLDEKFEITKRGSSFSTETVGAFTTFLAMVYILAVNPTILAHTGMDKAGLITVTALASALACFAMAFLANLPVALAPAMGANSYFAFAVCLSLGVDWRSALALVFYNGIFFLVISLLKIREKIVMSVPGCVRIGLQAGIGMFIAYLGLQSSKLIVADKFTISTAGNLSSPECLLAAAGFLMIVVLLARKFRPAIVLVIALITIASFFITGTDGQKLATAPQSVFSLPNSISQTFLSLDFSFPFREPMKAIPVIFVLLMMDMFDTIATLIALGRASGLMDKNGKMPKMSNALTSDALATIFGALLGTSTTGSYVESCTGIEAGARTGFSTLIVGILFLLALFITPLIACIPPIATAPVLMVVGLLMMRGFADLDFSKISEVVPAIVCMVVIAFSFKISLGYAAGIIVFVAVKSAVGRFVEIAPAVWIMFAAVLLFLYCSFN